MWSKLTGLTRWDSPVLIHYGAYLLFVLALATVLDFVVGWSFTASIVVSIGLGLVFGWYVDRRWMRKHPSGRIRPGD
jgi:hypothetical protein